MCVCVRARVCIFTHTHTHERVAKSQFIARVVVMGEIHGSTGLFIVRRIPVTLISRAINDCTLEARDGSGLKASRMINIASTVEEEYQDIPVKNSQKSVPFVYYNYINMESTFEKLRLTPAVVLAPACH